MVIKRGWGIGRIVRRLLWFCRVGTSFRAAADVCGMLFKPLLRMIGQKDNWTLGVGAVAGLHICFSCSHDLVTCNTVKVEIMTGVQYGAEARYVLYKLVWIL